MISVLIVEDEPLIAKAHEAYIGRLEGFMTAGHAATATQAMRIITQAADSQTPIDLVLLDIGLPDANGVELATAIAGIRPPPDLIAVTSQRDLAVVRAALSRGVLLYLLKPFTFATFRDKLEGYRRYRAAVGSSSDAVSQRDIDQAVAELRSSDSRHSAKTGAAADTSDSIARLVRDSVAGLTAAEVARALGTSRVTGWRHLESLADDGVMERITEYGNTGRPQVRYRWRVPG